MTLTDKLTRLNIRLIQQHKVNLLIIFVTCVAQTSQLDVPGPTGRRLDRQLGCSLHKDIVYVWWPTASEEAWPWAPMTGEKERANLILYAVNG